MSYSRSRGMGHGGGFPGGAPTGWFASGMDPYAARNSPPGSIYSPYGWGPDFMVGMPLNYTHHIDYVEEPVHVVRRDLANAHRPVPGARPIGPMRDTLAVGSYDHGQYEGDMQSLGCGSMGAESDCVATMEFAPVRGADGLMYANAGIARCAGTTVMHPAGVASPATGEPLFDQLGGPYSYMLADGSTVRCSWPNPGQAVKSAMQEARRATGDFVAIIYGPDDMAASLSLNGRLRALNRAQRQELEDAFNRVGQQRWRGMGDSGDGLSGL